MLGWVFCVGHCWVFETTGITVTAAGQHAGIEGDYVRKNNFDCVNRIAIVGNVHIIGMLGFES